MKSSIIVYSTKLAAKLCHLGYTLINSAPNHNNPNLKVYFFLNQPGIKEAIEQYKNA